MPGSLYISIIKYRTILIQAKNIFRKFTIDPSVLTPDLHYSVAVDFGIVKNIYQSLFSAPSDIL
jgi:hypothetical protein